MEKVNKTAQDILVLGIDDARRSDLTGSMILAGVLATPRAFAFLKNHGVKDSKQVCKNTRFKLAKLIRKKAINICVTRVFPKEMENNNLNDLEARAIARIMNTITQWDICIIDNFEPTKESLMARLKKFQPIFNENQIIAEHKADENYTACAAASIIAKTTSDIEIKQIEKETGMSMGGGASNDKKTIAWVKAHPNHSATRKKWATYKKIMQEGYQGGKLNGNQ